MGTIPHTLPAAIVALAFATSMASATAQPQTSDLEALLRQQGCRAGFADGRFPDRSPLSRWEAAALLNACLERSPTVTDQLLRLVEEYAPELKQLKGRTAELEAQQAKLVCRPGNNS